MSSHNLLERLKRARIVQVLAVYLGASWVILQIAEVLAEALSLPGWLLPVCVLLLLVGLLIILATAWVQSLASTSAAEEAGEVPTDWQIAPVDVLDSIKSGKFPHLTWGRAIMGGIMALSILFGGAGLYVLVTGGESFIGPQAAGASSAADGIAIVPFKVSGGDQELEVWREGMVDLLSTNLDGMGGYRTIDSRTVLARWREVVGGDDSPDLTASLRAAGRTGARYAVVGSVVGVGSSLRLVASVYDLADGSEIGSGQVEGTPDEILTLVDDLSLETMRLLLAGGGEELASTRNLANLTTHSLDALRAYLEGERHYRRAEFAPAVEAYERAIESDSAFALAHFRISDAYGWLESINSERAAELSARSIAYMDDLTPRNAVIVGAGDALYSGSLEYVDQLQEAVAKYPDDPEAWFMLTETYIHLGEGTGATLEEAREALNRAIELDPSFAPYYQHAADIAMALGDRTGAEEAMAAYHRLAPDAPLRAFYPVGLDLFTGDPDQRTQAVQAMAELDEREVSYLWGTLGPDGGTDDLAAVREIAEAFRDVSGDPGFDFALFRNAVNSGQWRRAEAIFNDSLPPGGPYALDAYRLWRFTDGADERYRDVARQAEVEANWSGLAAGIVAAEDGDRARLDAVLAGAREAIETDRAEGNLELARDGEVFVAGLEAYAQLKSGNAAQARTALERAQGRVDGLPDELIRLWLAETNEALGRTQEAMKWYGLLRRSPLTTSFSRYKVAQLAEQIGDLDRARSEWKAFLVNYAEADPENPRLKEAREAMARLGE
jgi:tetratricopeptide (TPR) repeat protein/TolB-like protein